jgi:hypothetical protein
MPRNRAFALTATFALAAGLALPLRADDPSAPSGSLSAADRETLIAMLEAGRAETEALVAQAEGDAFTRRPAEDRWSAAEVLEHIATTEETLFGMVQAALAAEPDPEAAQLIAAVPIADFATRVKDRSQPAEAPDMLRPTGGKDRDELLARYHAARDKTLELVRTTQAAVADHTAATPMGKLTVHHFLTLIAAHNLRHNQQMAEAIEQVTAPAAAAATGT